MTFKPHNYQQRAIDFVVDHPFCALFMDMGLGKSAITLTALRALQKDYLDVRKILVIAPKSVAQNTWGAECAKWDHLHDVKLSLIMGERWKREDALFRTQADI